MPRKYKSTLIISDTHFPFHHKDTFIFLKKLKQELAPTNSDLKDLLVIHIGDEICGHAWSFHTSEVDADGPNMEFQKALLAMKELYKIFPEVHVMHSNHGSLHQRKKKEGQIPDAFMRSYKDAYEAPTDWHWHPTFRQVMPNGEEVMFAHGMGADAYKNAIDLGISFVQGHFHSRLEAKQSFSPFHGKNIFGMTVGCLIDDSAYTFRYNKTTASRPKIGCGLIVNSSPVLVPMLLGKDGRWLKKLK